MLGRYDSLVYIIFRLAFLYHIIQYLDSAEQSYIFDHLNFRKKTNTFFSA